MTAIWTLHYHSSVTTFLYSIRGTEKATEIRDAIVALQYKEDPATGCRSVEERQNRYEFEVAGHWVGIRVLTDDKAVRVLYVTLEV